MECIFCDIINKKSPALIIYEDDFTIAIMSNAKDVDGHILVLPKKHVQGVIDSDTETLYKVMNTINRISKHLINNCSYDAINLLNASGEDAGQSIGHLHFHLIPRKKDDGIDAWPSFGNNEFSIEKTYKELKMI